jgi:hypothetical protein
MLTTTNLTIEKIIENEKRIIDSIGKRSFSTVYSQKEYLGVPMTNGLFGGQCASGKSPASLCAHVYNRVVNNGISSHLVLRSQHVIDYCKTIDDFNKNFWIPKAKGFNVAARLIKPLLIGNLKSDSNGHLIVPEELSNLYKGNHSKKYIYIIIVLCHNVQLQRWLKLRLKEWEICRSTPNIKEYKEMIICDESHKSLHPNALKRIMKEEDLLTFENWPQDGRLSKYELIEYLNIIPNTQIIAMSATYLQNIFNKKFPLSFIVQIKPNEHYLGFKKCKYNIIKELKENTEPYKDSELIRTIKEWDNTSVFEAADYGMEKDHPLDALIMVSPYLEKNKKIAEYIYTTYPNKFNTIINSYKGYDIQLTKECGEYFRVHNGGKITVKDSVKKYTASISDANTVRFPPKVGYYGIKQLFSDLDTLVKKLVTISGNRLEEGIRPNSTDYRLAPNRGFFRFRKTLTCDKKQQIIARAACGERHNKMTMSVCVTSKDHIDILKSHDILQVLQAKLVDDMDYKTCIIQDIIYQSKIDSRRIPTTKLCKSRMKMFITTTNNDDFGDESTIKQMEIDIIKSESRKSVLRRKRKRQRVQSIESKRPTPTPTNITDSQWTRVNGRLTRDNNETCISFLKRKIIAYTTETEEGKKNTWKTANEWLLITGLCGFGSFPAYHGCLNRDLINHGTVEQKNHFIRVSL